MKRAKNLALLLTAILALSAYAHAAPPVPLSSRLPFSSLAYSALIDVPANANHTQWVQAIKRVIANRFAGDCLHGPHSDQCMSTLRSIGIQSVDYSRMRVQLPDSEHSSSALHRTFSVVLKSFDLQEYYLWGRYELEAVPVVNDRGATIGYYLDIHTQNTRAPFSLAQSYYVLRNSAGEVIMNLVQGD